MVDIQKFQSWLNQNKKSVRDIVHLPDWGARGLDQNVRSDENLWDHIPNFGKANLIKFDTCGQGRSDCTAKLIDILTGMNKRAVDSYGGWKDGQ